MVYFEGILKSVNLFADPWLLCSTTEITYRLKNVSEMYSSVIKCRLLIQSYSISIRTWFTEMCFTLIFISNFCIWPISNCKNFYFDKILYFILFIATLNILRKCVYAEPGYESSTRCTVHLIGKKIDPMLHFFKSLPKYQFWLSFISFHWEFSEKRRSSQYQSPFSLPSQQNI